MPGHMRSLLERVFPQQIMRIKRWFAILAFAGSASAVFSFGFVFSRDRSFTPFMTREVYAAISSPSCQPLRTSAQSTVTVRNIVGLGTATAATSAAANAAARAACYAKLRLMECPRPPATANYVCRKKDGGPTGDPQAKPSSSTVPQCTVVNPVYRKDGTIDPIRSAYTCSATGTANCRQECEPISTGH